MGLEVGSNEIGIEAVAERLSAEFGSDLRDVRIQEPVTVVAHCDAAALKNTARRLKAHPEVGYETLNFVAGVDKIKHLESVYHLFSWKTNTYLELHVRIPRGKAEVETVSDVWLSADWHEREAWDMLGIRYLGHPDLRRILLKDDFVGHPLRKDYVDLVENHPNV
jgi:NADH:ubiquinone oxidoreductase subunit C